MKPLRLATLLGLVACACGKPASGPGRQVEGKPVETQAANAEDQKPAFRGQTRASYRTTDVAFDVQVVARGLEHPWSVAFLPDGKMLVTERPGRLRVVDADGTLSRPVAGVPEVDARDQGGLLEVAVDPRFADNQLIYLTFAEADGGVNGTAVARARLVTGTDPVLDHVSVIWRQKPKLSSTKHFGGRIVFDEAGAMFVTTGERSILRGREQAQQLDSALGEGITQKAGMEQPIYYWDPVIAPSGMAFYTGDAFPAWRGSLFVGALAGKHLVRLTLDGNRVVGEERLLAGRARIRDVRVGPDGLLYLLTDEDDGQLLRLAPRERDQPPQVGIR